MSRRGQSGAARTSAWRRPPAHTRGISAHEPGATAARHFTTDTLNLAKRGGVFASPLGKSHVDAR
jgi:hypothetical protein